MYKITIILQNEDVLVYTVTNVNKASEVARYCVEYLVNISTITINKE